MCIGECIPFTRCQEFSQVAPTFLPWIRSTTGNIIPCDNPIGSTVIRANMSSKLFARSVYHNDRTLTQICMRETVQQLIEQCLILIDESDVLYNTMTCRSQEYYLYYRSKLIVPSSTVNLLNSITSDSDSVLMSQAFISVTVYNMSQGICLYYKIFLVMIIIILIHVYTHSVLNQFESVSNTPVVNTAHGTMLPYLFTSSSVTIDDIELKCSESNHSQIIIMISKKR